MAKKSTNTAKSILVKGSIDRGKAKNRIACFSRKLAIIGASHPLSLEFEKNIFLDFLKNKILKNTQITGMRVYFGCYPDNIYGKKGTLTLVFSPTKTQTVAGYQSDLSDTGKLYISQKSTNGFSITEDTINGNLFIKEYLKTSGLYAKLSGSLSGSGETKSLWYSRENLQLTSDEITASHPNANSVIAKFAAYDATEYDDVNCGSNYPNPLRVYVRNQLSVIYHTDDYKKVRLTRLEEDYYDTGAPCPPATGCENSSFPTP